MAENLEGWKVPEEQLITEVLARIGEPQHRRVFFERLENPTWVAALLRRGVFDTPPESRFDAKGREYWQPWPDGDYLVRMASLVPQEVTDALLRAAHSSNRIVQGALLRAAIALPVAHAERLTGVIADLARSGALGYAPEIAELMAHFAGEGREAPTVALATAAFLPRPAEDDRAELSGRRRVTAGLDRHLYAELLPRVAEILEEAQGPEALSTLTSWLETYLVVSHQHVTRDGYDLSHIWRPSIAADSQNHGYEDYGDALVDAVRDLSVRQAARGRPLQEIVSRLEQNEQPLLVRVGMHTLAERVSSDAAARVLAEARLMDPKLLEIWFRHEYAELASAALPLIDPATAERWQSLILEGWPELDEELARRAERRQEEGESLESARERVGEYWLLQLLSGIRRESLPPGCEDRLAVLQSKHGALEHANYASWSSSWVGPSSPVSFEEIKDLSPDELIDMLMTWEPERGEPWEPSKEGLARAFQSVIKDRPDPFVDAAARLSDLGPLYVGAFLAGLREAVQEGNSFDWSSCLRFCAGVTAEADDGRETSHAQDEDSVWRYAQRSVASLIEAGVGATGASALPANAFAEAVEVLAPIVGHADPTAEHEARYGGSNMDPLTLSLNTTRPAALRAVIRVGSKARDAVVARDDATPLDQVIDQVLDLIASRISPTRDESLAEAAAIGEGFGRLAWMDREWTEQHAPLLLSPDPFGDVVLTVALATYRPSKVLIEVLTPAAVRLLERSASGEEITTGWRNDRSAVELLGDHLVTLMMWDLLHKEDPLVVSYFDLASPANVASVLGHLGWQLGRSEDTISTEVLGRAKALWDWRAELVSLGSAELDELNEFYWWARSGQFEPEWWIERLLQAAESTNFDSHGLIGEELEAAASQNPLQTVRVLERLLNGREEPFARYDLVEHAPTILAAALDSHDDEAVDAAKRVMDSLGRGGHLRIKEIVAQQRGLA